MQFSNNLGILVNVQIVLEILHIFQIKLEANACLNSLPGLLNIDQICMNISILR
jgi:hypothetical protein